MNIVIIPMVSADAAESKIAGGASFERAGFFVRRPASRASVCHRLPPPSYARLVLSVELSWTHLAYFCCLSLFLCEFYS